MDAPTALFINEICHRIGLFLDLQSAAACSTVCKTWHTYFDPFVWHELDFQGSGKARGLFRDKKMETELLARKTRHTQSILYGTFLHRDQFNLGPDCNRLHTVYISGNTEGWGPDKRVPPKVAAATTDPSHTEDDAAAATPSNTENDVATTTPSNADNIANPASTQVVLAPVYSERRECIESCKKLLRKNRGTLRTLCLSKMDRLINNQEIRNGSSPWNPLVTCLLHTNLTTLELKSIALRGKHVAAFWALCQRLETLELEYVTLDLLRLPAYDGRKALARSVAASQLDHKLSAAGSGGALSKRNANQNATNGATGQDDSNSTESYQNGDEQDEEVEENDGHVSCRFPRLKKLTLSRMGDSDAHILNLIVSDCPRLQNLKWNLLGDECFFRDKFLLFLGYQRLLSRFNTNFITFVPKSFVRNILPSTPNLIARQPKLGKTTWPFLESVEINEPGSARLSSEEIVYLLDATTVNNNTRGNDPALLSPPLSPTSRPSTPTHPPPSPPVTFKSIRTRPVVCSPALIESFLRHSQTLVHVHFMPKYTDYNDWSKLSPLIQELLSSCVNLEYIQASTLYVKDIIAGLQKNQEWVCLKLKEFRVYIAREEENGVSYLKPIKKAEANDLQRVFQAISRLERVEVIEMDRIGVSLKYTIGYPVISIPFQLRYGLAQLKTLTKVRELRLYSVQFLSAKDVRWMLDNWRNLESVYFFDASHRTKFPKKWPPMPVGKPIAGMGYCHIKKGYSVALKVWDCYIYSMFLQHGIEINRPKYPDAYLEEYKESLHLLEDYESEDEICGDTKDDAKPWWALDEDDEPVAQTPQMNTDTTVTEVQETQVAEVLETPVTNALACIAVA
ncbi:hypothetical protein BGW38_008768 [Lunasporangiospora selenospora]|uniref:F-box domain-containing protein n=1 Tax=Lunasporangiospora selenospora TaxID=979761 RepID=A0A9P6KGD4_9FUNG|nr:hypothetical protein BGW38_008768 [Lunasporangiospora selenospora]